MNTIKVIKSQTEYEGALKAIECLMSKELLPGSDEFDQLEVLSILIEKYESENIDLGPVDPIEALKLRMDQGNLRNKDLVAYIGSIGKVSEVLNRKRPLSLNMIRALHKGLGIPYSSLMEDPRDATEAPALDWLKFPLKEMLERGIIESEKLNDAKEYAEEKIKIFFGDRLDSSIPALLRTMRAGRKMDDYALQVWHVLSLKLAEERALDAEFNQESLDESFFEQLLGLSILDNGPLLAKEYLEKFGIHLVINPHFSKTYLDGAALLLEDNTPVIAMTLRHDRLDNFWFVLMHEIAHVTLHLSDADERAFYDDLDSNAISKIEEQADNFAANKLVPPAAWEEIRHCTSAPELVAASKKYNRSAAILAGALRKERSNYRIFNQLVGRGEVRELFE